MKRVQKEKIIFLKCNMRNSKTNLSLPLDFLYPDEFGEMDDDERQLINEYGALDLVLIENASELFRQAMQNGKVFEKILKSIVRAQNNKNIQYLYSETFPFYVSAEKKKKFYKSEKSASSTQTKKNKYLRLVNEYRKKIDMKKQYVGIIAVDLESSGGHYIAFYYSNGNVKLFDSMQTSISENEKKKLYEKNVKSASDYTHYFYQLIHDIFPESLVEVPDCIKKEASLQYTGGFIEDLPYFLEESNVDEQTKKCIILQTTESQNHFCYVWAIWWIHLNLMGLDFMKILEVFNDNDPLIVIKKYGWCLIKILGISVTHKEFYLQHFMSIWSNGKDKLSVDFNRYALVIPDCNHINDAFIESTKNLSLNLEKKTKVPTELTLE